VNFAGQTAPSSTQALSPAHVRATNATSAVGSQVTQIFAQPKGQPVQQQQSQAQAMTHRVQPRPPQHQQASAPSCSATTTTAAASFSATCLVRAKPSPFHSYAFGRWWSSQRAGCIVHSRFQGLLQSVKSCTIAGGY
jgi:hypothetical protein